MCLIFIDSAYLVKFSNLHNKSLVTTLKAFSVHLLPVLLITMNNDYALHNTIPMMVYTKLNTRSGYRPEVASEGP